MMRILLLATLLTAPAFAAEAPATLAPGLYEETIRITGATLAGLPAGMPLPPATRRRICVPAALAIEPARFFAEREQPAPDCTTDRARIAGGKIEMAGVCQSAGGATTAARGSYGGGAYTMTVATTMLRAEQPVVVTSEVVAARVGDCAEG